MAATIKKPREKPFLDDPGLYPEFARLVERRKFLHFSRQFCHRHRTVMLLLLIAISVAASGAKAPPASELLGRGGNGWERRRALQQWAGFLHEGLMLEALALHFEGLTSAAACMLVVAAVFLLVYPLHGIMASLHRNRQQRHRQRQHHPHQNKALPTLLCTVVSGSAVVGVPSAIGWAISVWAAGVFRWGVASGFCVGLHCCALSLKSWSFAHKIGFDVVGEVTLGGCCSGCEDVDGGVNGDDVNGDVDGDDADGGDVVMKAVRNGDGEGEGKSWASERQQEGADDREDDGIDGNGSTVDGDGGTARADGSADVVNDSRSSIVSDHDENSAADSTEATSLVISDISIADNICAIPSPNPAPTPIATTNLTFREFAFFLLLAPSLVCEPSWLRQSFRLRPRIRGALVEFLHAALTYVALHVYCVNLVAPIFRILAAAWSSSSSSSSIVSASSLGGLPVGSGMMTLNVESLEELRANGGGGWVISFVDLMISTVAASGCGAGDRVGDAASWGRFVTALIPAEAYGCGSGNGDSSDAAQMMMMMMAEGAEPASGEMVGDPAAALPEILRPLSEWAWVGIVALATCFACVISPLNHALPFYAFFHCICLGSAKLWGYPDRNFYGPWWLAYDHIKDYFRMWSAPVSRWLSVCIQKPILEASARAHPAVTPRNRGITVSNSTNDNSICSTASSTVIDNSNTAKYAVDTPKPSAATTSITPTTQKKENKAIKMTTPVVSPAVDNIRAARVWSVLMKNASVAASFLVSGLLHEAVAYLGMRRTFFPLNTFFLLLSASMFPTWDLVFPVVRAPSRDVKTPSSKRLAGTAAPSGRKRGGKRGVFFASDPTGDDAALSPGYSTESIQGEEDTSVASMDDDPMHQYDLYSCRQGYHLHASDVNIRAVAAGEGDNADGGGEKLMSGDNFCNRYVGDVGVDRGLPVVVFCALSSFTMTPVFDFLAWRWWGRAFLS